MTLSEKNHIQIVQVVVPAFDENPRDFRGIAELPRDKGEQSKCKISVLKDMSVPFAVNRLRYMPQDPSLIACKTNGPDIRLCKISTSSNSAGSAVGVLQGHGKAGWGLSWSPLHEGLLVSGSDDCKICVFDVSKPVAPLCVLEGHSDVIDDVDCCHFDKNAFASVSDDKKLCLWDLRDTSVCFFRISISQAVV